MLQDMSSHILDLFGVLDKANSDLGLEISVNVLAAEQSVSRTEHVSNRI